jgi:hypothetical protein
MKLTGNSFENSPVCKGVGYIEDGASMDIAKIELTGRYPERGWVMNETNYEMAYVLAGAGEFIVKDEAPIRLVQGDVISIAAGKKYTWNGNLTLIVACTPPFDPAQHKLLEEEQ